MAEAGGSGSGAGGGAGRRSSSASPDTMGKSRKLRKPTKERWLLTRKTWKYMADAGRRLIPEGALNRPEDVPKIEAYFQEVCQKEPKFLLWRKSSYPGAIGFRPHRRRRDRTKGGSVRQTASSADEAEEATTPPPKKFPGQLIITHTSGGRFDISKMKQDFMASSTSKDPKAALKSSAPPPPQPTAAAAPEDPEQKELIDMIKKYLTVQDKPPPPAGQPGFEYQDLIDKLQQHLALVFGKQNETEKTRRSARVTAGLSAEADPVQRTLLDTLSRYYSRSPNRDHVISDLLTDRKLLKKLYFDLRQTKGFRNTRSGLVSSASSSSLGHNWKGSLSHLRRDEEYEEEDDDDYREGPWEKPNRSFQGGGPPPLVEVLGETGTHTAESGIQTDPIRDDVLKALKASLAERRKQRQAEESEGEPGGRGELPKVGDGKKSPRRRSSVDHDDVSQSVSDTIKRYLRMARKKSVDADKADRFKRINYDKNLRNIKPKGELSMPGDDDGLNKGCQTEEEWLDAYVGSAAAGRPAAQGERGSASSFFSHLLHGNRDKDRGSGGGSAPVSVCASPTGGAAVMQKSRSSSSVVQHVSRRIWRTRSKSRGPAAQPASWLPQGIGTWTDGVGGHQVVLNNSSLLVLSEAERRALRQAALARLRELNLGIPITIPEESTTSSQQKPKRRAYLLKRKALTTGFLKDGDKDKDKESPGGLVFGVPLSQCVEANRGGSLQREKDSRRGSRSSFTSLLDRDRGDDSGSCESLASRDRLASSEGELEGFDESAPARVPALVVNCVDHLRAFGLRTLGLFRVGTSKKRVRQLREEWDCGKEGPFDADTCPHDVATLLKEYLRDLPDPLLCRDLYHAFVKTQRIRNRRLQQEALQLLVMLLPSAHQDTLHSLLSFLGEVADNCDDRADSKGETIAGNKMDSTNLATVFAPNILHCIKSNSSGKEISAERAEERIDVINVVRSLLDQRDILFHADAELRHEACLQMATTHPALLDALLGRMLANQSRKDDLISSGGGADSDSQSSPPSQRRVWSREECLHQAAGMGGPNVDVTHRQRERVSREGRSSSKKRWKDEQKLDSGSSGSSLSSTMTIITSKLRGGQSNQDDQGTSVVYSSSKISSVSNSKSRSDSASSMSDTYDSSYTRRRRSSSSEAPVITASLRLPLSLALDDPDIPYIEETGNAAAAGAQPSAPPRRRQRSISGSDSSIASQPITGTLSFSHVSNSSTTTNPAGYDSAVGSSATLSSPPRNLTPTSSSAGDGGLFSSPPSWASTPPMSPTSPTDRSVDYEQQFHTTTARMSLPVAKTLQKQNSKEAPILQKVTITSTGELQQQQQQQQKKLIDAYRREISYQSSPQQHSAKTQTRILELPKSHSASSVVQQPGTSPGGLGQRRVDFTGGIGRNDRETTKYTPSISSIGGAVLRSKTADFERLLHSPNSAKLATPAPAAPSAVATTTADDKKKYTKRRYTDSRHQTRHIPDAETLDSTTENSSRGDSSSSNVSGATKVGLVYKRRELISSVQTKEK